MWLIVFYLSIVSQTSGVSYNQPKLCPTATWNPNAITLPIGSATISKLASIFVNSSNAIYATDKSKIKGLVCLNDNITPITIISDDLSNPQSIFVAKNGDIFVNNGDRKNQVVKWSSDTRTLVSVMSVNSACYGLFVDINDTLYCSLYYDHKVVKRWLCSNTATVTIAAGTDAWGSDSNTLSNPYGIFIDINFDLYVADYGNSRIQLFRLGEQNGITVAGSESSKPTIDLKWPTGVVLDADKYLFIVDQHKSRIVGSGPNGFRCIVGCSTGGSSSTQLWNPISLSFDSSGNIFVADSANSRIQKFLLSPTSCDQITMPQTTHTSTETYVSSSAVMTTSNPEADTTNTLSEQETTTTLTSVKSILTSNFNDPSTSSLITTPGVTQAAVTSSQKTPTVKSTLTGTPDMTNIEGLSTRLLLSSQIASLAVSGAATTTTASSRIVSSSEIASAITREMTELVSTSTETVLVSEVVSLPTTTNYSLSSYFFPTPCNDSTLTGFDCNISNTACDILKPCRNNGNCTDNDTEPYGYICECLPDFNGTQCQFDHRPCKQNICWNGGTCNKTENGTFKCICLDGWRGQHCETKIDSCANITCLNNGICRPLFTNYTCECLGDSYSGRHCENTATRIKIYRIVCRSIAYIAILVMISAAMFIVIMDILKYCFGIDPVHEERERIRRKKQAKKRKPVIQRFVYVNPPASSLPKQSISKTQETTV